MSASATQGGRHHHIAKDEKLLTGLQSSHQFIISVQKSPKEDRW